MYKITIALIALTILFFLGSCKSKKSIIQQPINKITTTGNAPDANLEGALLAINSNKNDYSYIKADAATYYNDGSSSYNLDVELVCEKDKYIWLRVTAIFGIEAARVMITPDKIQVLDRLNRKHITAGYSYLKSFTDIPLTFTQLQNLIVGNALFNATLGQSTTKNIDAEILINYIFNQNKQSNLYNATTYKNRQSIVNDTLKNQALQIDYSNFIANGTNTYPANISINIKGEKNIACQFKLSNFAFDKKGEIQFSVPKSYQAIQY